MKGSNGNKFSRGKSDKKKGLEYKISSMVVKLMGVTCLIIAAAAGIGAYISTTSALETSINEASSLAAARVSAELGKYTAVAYETGSIARLANPDNSVEAKKEIIDQRVADHNFTNGTIVDENGIDMFRDADLSDREYFKVCMNGNTYVSTPTISKITNEMTFMVAAPLWADGIPNSEVVGVIVFTPDSEALNDIMKGIKLGDEGTAFMVDKDGNTIASVEDGVAGNQNIIELAKSDSSYSSLAKIVSSMIESKDGFGEYRSGLKTNIVSYSPVSDTDGWSIGVVAVRNEFLGTFYNVIFIVIVVIIVCVANGIRIAKKRGKSIAAPIISAVGRLELLSEGDLHTEVPNIVSNDETDELLSCMRDTIERLNHVISDINVNLAEMSNGNFALKFEKTYAGDFEAISNSFRGIIESLSSAFRSILGNADVVYEGSNSVSSAAQSLADGATDQASSVQELTATINEISDKISNNAENAESAKEVVIKMNENITHSNAEMQNMITSMSKIKEASNQIADIIKTIEDIASQTNLLSLNASIEAARAGEMGRGFAVVAGEVGNLAEQSAEAAKHITLLINNSMSAVEEGTELVEKTAGSLVKVVEDAALVDESISDIAEASMKQAEAAKQITDAVNQIAAVVQENSAAAEESASTSQELTSEATLLKEQLDKFKY